MKMPVAGRALALAAVCGMPGLVAGCSGVTYGTGTSTELQTIQDITGMLALGAPDKPEIDTKPRGGIVAPPTTASLPAPVDDTVTGSVEPSDWPNDPDEGARKRKAEQDAQAPQSASANAIRDPGIRLSKAMLEKQKQQQALQEKPWDYSRGPNPNLMGRKKEFAEMKSERGGSLDANGQPVRRYLTEPPAEYRVPDADAPVDPKAPPKKKKPFSFRDLWPF
jgi:hypothetical protein